MKAHLNWYAFLASMSLGLLILIARLRKKPIHKTIHANDLIRVNPKSLFEF